MGDPEEPGGERRRLEAELADRLEHAQEGLRREVLGVVLVAERHVQVAVDPVEMDQVQLLERVPVALLPALDEPPDLGARRPAPLVGRLVHPTGPAPPDQIPNPTRDSRA